MTLSEAEFPPKLRKYLASRECVAFVGAGFSIPCGMPNWGQLLHGLLNEAELSLSRGSPKNELISAREVLANGEFASAASAVERLLSPEEIRRHLISEFDGRKIGRLTRAQKKRMESRMENLVCGPWAGIITTNFDNLIDDAFSRYGQNTSPFRCDGAQKSLGHVLCIPPGAGRFFVKLHGESWGDRPVLSTRDYIRAWLSSNRIRSFLTAVMLRFRLVFIGCSLEEEFLRLRGGLWDEFEKALPLAYALLPDTPANRGRRDNLRENWGIESLLYPTTRDHMSVDQFLIQSRKCTDMRVADSSPNTLQELKDRPVSEQLEAIGAINRHLLGVVCRQENRRLNYAHALDPHFENVPHQNEGRHVLSTLSETERLYRLLFLVSLDLVREQMVHGTRCFHVQPIVAEAIGHLGDLA